MFYSGNDNYMQDLYFGNQMYGTNTYNPNGINNMQNPMYMNNGMYVNQFQNPVPNQQPVNINSLYPSSYRILMPVVSRVVSNSNLQILNEDVLNNMVDTVYNITEGQLNYENGNEQVTTQERNTNSTSVSQTNQNTTTTTRVSNNDTNQTTRNTNSTNNSNDNLLRDLIKILIIREIISRRHFQNTNMQNTMNMYNMNPYCNS